MMVVRSTREGRLGTDPKPKPTGGWTARRVPRSRPARVASAAMRVQIMGAVPLAASAAGTATGAGSRQQSARGEVQQASPPGGSGQPDRRQPEQPAQEGAASDGNESCRGPAWTVQHEPARRALQGTTWTSWNR
jgi:hypothetical protein